MFTREVTNWLPTPVIYYYLKGSITYLTQSSIYSLAIRDTPASKVHQLSRYLSQHPSSRLSQKFSQQSVVEFRSQQSLVLRQQFSSQLSSPQRPLLALGSGGLSQQFYQFSPQRPGLSQGQWPTLVSSQSYRVASSQQLRGSSSLVTGQYLSRYD